MNDATVAYEDRLELACIAYNLGKRAGSGAIKGSLHEEPPPAGELSPGQAAALLSSVGCRFRQAACPTETLPDLYADASRRGHVVLLWVRELPGLGPNGWWCADFCQTHAPRILRCTMGGVRVRGWEEWRDCWTGHLLVSDQLVHDLVEGPGEV